MLTSARIKEHAGTLGFDLCGIAPAGDLPELTFLPSWLARGYGGTMTYLNRSVARRADVRRVVASAKSVIVTGTVYNTDAPYSTESHDPDRAHISRYAWGDDYHHVIGRRLEALLAWMREQSDEPLEARAYVDTGPVQERVYARHAGIGWIGKNTCVINPTLGSWLFLGEIICSLDLPPDEPALDQCGECTLCIEACPTRAIVGAGVLDATRCISYLTIEQKGPIPDEFAAAVGSRVYGCDVCQEVCPWNQMAPRSADPAWQARPEWRGATVSSLSAMSDDDLRRSTRDSAMERARVAGFRRNVQIAEHNRTR